MEDLNAASNVIKGVGIFIMAAFMPWTAYSFLTSRLTRKEKEYREMLDLHGYSGKHRPVYLPSLENRAEQKDYLLPVAFATVIVALCAIVLLGNH